MSKDMWDCGSYTFHCWHPTRGPVMVVLKDGYVHETCCRCQASRTVHAAHSYDKLSGSRV